MTAPYQMNPNWRESMEKSKKLADDAKNPPVRKPKIIYQKSEVAFEHPAKGPDHCGQCVHFRGPHACEMVAGYIRPADWCKKFEERK